MPVDFGELCVKNAMSIMGLPIKVNPIRSAPRLPPYDATGIWSRTHLQIMLDNGAELSTTTLKISVYLRDAAFNNTGPPVQGDEIYLTLFDSTSIVMKIDDDQPDGYGNLDLICKFLRYPETKAKTT